MTTYLPRECAVNKQRIYENPTEFIERDRERPALEHGSVNLVVLSVRYAQNAKILAEHFIWSCWPLSVERKTLLNNK